jgi:hypothetical protein
MAWASSVPVVNRKIGKQILGETPEDKFLMVSRHILKGGVTMGGKE